MIEPAIDYIPHDRPMALIEDIVEVRDEFIICSVKPEKSHLFRDSKDRIPSWTGIEFMAQTIGAYVGWTNKQKGLEVKVGFLLGCRKLTLETDFFTEGTIYTQAELVFKNEELGSFKCTILGQDKKTVLATGTINVFQPNDIKKFLKEKNLK